MQEKLLFEYAVIRIVPRVERGEFINAGIIMYCAKQRFLGIKFHVDETKIRCLNKETDISEIKGYLNAFNTICEGGEEAGSLRKLSKAERFRWLTAKRSTVLQVSAVHPGFCQDPHKKLDQLFDQLVRS